MVMEIIFFFAIGTAMGLIAGLLPGLHPNTIAIIASTFMISGFFPSSLCFICFMVSLGISNSISSFIPAIYLGAPDESSSMAALPGHRLLKCGMGYHAIKLTVIGSLGSLLFCSLMIPFSIYAMPVLYETLRPQLWWFLSVIVIYMILIEKKKMHALFCFFAAGAIGIFGAALPINQNYYLFPLLSGLFGMPLLIISLKNNEHIAEQKYIEKFVSRISAFRSVIKGSLAGLVVGLLPGVGTSQAAALASAGESKQAESETFLITLGSVSAANTLFSFLALWLIGNPRSGMAVEIGRFVEIGFGEFAFMVSVALAACGISAILTMKSAKLFSYFVRKVNYQMLSLAVIFSTIFMVFYFTSYYGIFIMAISTFLGIYTNISGINRSHMMGCLMLPTIIFFAGI